MNATLPLFATQQTKQFHFEGNLPHQQRAVDSILAVLETVTFTKPNQQMALLSNHQHRRLNPQPDCQGYSWQ